MTLRISRPGRARITLSMVVVGAVSAMGLSPVSTSAQEVDLEASLRCFGEFHRSGARIPAVNYACPSGAVTMEILTRSPEYFGDQLVQTALDRLVELALSTTNEHLQAAACTAILGAGVRRDDRGQPRVSGVVERAERLYFSGRLVHRGWCFETASLQADRARAAAFLKRVATHQPAPTHWRADSFRAIRRLGSMGEEGRAVLTELVADESVSGYGRRLAEQILDRPPGRGAR